MRQLIRLVICLGFFFVFMSCGQEPMLTNPCTNKSDVCIAVWVDGDVTGLDQLAITLNNRTINTPMAPKAFSLPTVVPVIPPIGLTGMRLIKVDGLSLGKILAHDEKTIDIPSMGSLDVMMRLSKGTAPTGVQLNGTDPTT